MVNLTDIRVLTIYCDWIWRPTEEYVRRRVQCTNWPILVSYKVSQKVINRTLGKYVPWSKVSYGLEGDICRGTNWLSHWWRSNTSINIGCFARACRTFTSYIGENFMPLYDNARFHVALSKRRLLKDKILIFFVYLMFI